MAHSMIALLVIEGFDLNATEVGILDCIKKILVDVPHRAIFHEQRIGEGLPLEYNKNKKTNGSITLCKRVVIRVISTMAGAVRRAVLGKDYQYV